MLCLSNHCRHQIPSAAPAHRPTTPIKSTRFITTPFLAIQFPAPPKQIPSAQIPSNSMHAIASAVHVGATLCRCIAERFTTMPTRVLSLPKLHQAEPFYSDAMLSTSIPPPYKNLLTADFPFFTIEHRRETLPDTVFDIRIRLPGKACSVNPCCPCPISEAHGQTVDGNQPRLFTVYTLDTHRNPSAILRIVVSATVDSIERKLVSVSVFHCPVIERRE